VQRIWLSVLLALLVFLTYQVFAPFLTALVWGIILSICFYPVHARIRQRLKRPNLAALLSTSLLIIVVIVPLLGVGVAFTQQTVQMATNLQNEWAEGRIPLERLWHNLRLETAWTWLQEYGVTKETLQQTLRVSLQRVAGFAAAQMGHLAANILLFFFNLFVMLFATFYLFRDGPKLLDRLRRVLPLQKEQRENLIVIANDVLYASVLSSIVIAVLQGLLGGLLFWALGIQAPLLWGVVMGFLSLLPLVGAWLIWLPAALFFVLEGSFLKALILVAVGAGLIGVVDNVLRPILVSGRARLNGLLVFISILGGIAAFGIVGIILGPILVALGNAVLTVYSQNATADTTADTSPGETPSPPTLPPTRPETV